MRRRLPLLPILAILFFGSGACALIYQVLWLRTLGWVFGVTVFAASTVWATFMAGLALGSIGAGLVADRVRNPLRWFGLAEALIGITAAATPAGLAALQQLYVSSYPALPHSLGALTAIRFGIAFAVLIVPTALMGATLPLVVKATAFQRSAPGQRLGLLYGSNAFGAIAGTLIAGLYLIPTHGIRQTFLITAAVNLAIGLTAFALSLAGALSVDAAGPVQRPTAPPPPPLTAATSERQLRFVLGVFALSGAISLALEVVWFRVLTLFLRPTVYGFAVMLATILTGIALGSYIVTPLLDRRARWLTILAALELAIGIAVALSFAPLTYLNGLSNTLAPLLSRMMPEYLVYPLSGSLLAIFPTALLMGVAFPIGLHLWTSGSVHAGGPSERLGRFYSLNVSGGIVGSLLAGFLLLPRLGSRTSLIVLAAAAFASGLLLLTVSELRRRTRWSVGAAAGVVFAAAIWLSPDPFAHFVALRYPNQTIVWREESAETTVVVHENRSRQLSLTVNGNHEASTGGGMTQVHKRIGHLPMAVHPYPQTALVIGLGGGATAGAVSLHTGVHVDVVELSAAVVKGAGFFAAINDSVLTRPNVRLRVDDGRNYLMLTPRRYDVITADVIIPIFAGSGNLYSREYFTLMRRVLNDGGLVMQWVAGTEAEYKTIARTFLSVFPETTVWADGSLLIGSMTPLALRRADFERKARVPGRAQGFREAGFESFDALLNTFVAGPRELAAFVGDGPVLTDDRPLAEYFLSLPRDRQPDTRTMRSSVGPYVVPD